MTNWTTLHMEVTTPLFNGDADPEREAGGHPGVRVPSLRGAMRFWFRAFVGGVIGPDLALLATLERTVFGSTDASCPVPLRIPNPPVQRAARAEHLDRWIVYLLGQGLGDLRNQKASRPYVVPGDTFELQLRLRNAGRDRHVDENIGALTLASLWLLSAYGGLGARTRRGFGGVRITGTEGWLPPPWTTESILSPGLDHYEARKFLWPDGALGKCLVPLIKKHGIDYRNVWPVPPTFPVLHREHTIASVNGGGCFNAWSDTLSHAGQQLRHFRASEDYPGANYGPKRKTPEWNDVIWGSGDHFPLGALGLPVVFKKNGPFVNVERQGDQLRRASPLWLRAVGSSDEWLLFSFAFLGEFLPGPDAPGVNLRNGNRPPKPLRVETDDVRRLAKQWIAGTAADSSFVDTRRE
ncbi:MAG: type III-B CRISPR module RAMP protein Cmr1 [Pseudonocardiaceae bacterium]